ncbi:MULTISPECIES: response regulator transcription factor [unclassified Granulicatella]|uniref:response regulator transcription factor n=1 Tax=unclassified Granulicatella TaxID=2630493 RepID=UPI001ADDC86F|nr:MULTISPECIES: response regulator transcription factor [unclassified Granulicatella]
MKKVLIVDDEQHLRTLLRFNLEKAGYSVDEATDGQEALDKVSEQAFDFILLDLMMPILDGIEVCKRLRRDKCLVPIIMLTAKDDEVDKIIGLELGADDYMTKPFSPREVLARMKAILRRTNSSQYKYEHEQKRLYLGEIDVDIDMRKVCVKDKKVKLTPKEFDILVYMLTHQGKVITRERLIDMIWQSDYVGETRMVDMHVANLREKIEQDPKNPVYIHTVRGVGYQCEERHEPFI